jgi:hypothetical protein
MPRMGSLCNCTKCYESAILLILSKGVGGQQWLIGKTAANVAVQFLRNLGNRPVGGAGRMLCYPGTFTFSAARAERRRICRRNALRKLVLLSRPRHRSGFCGPAGPCLLPRSAGPDLGLSPGLKGNGLWTPQNVADFNRLNAVV